jgi:hypothetical protein
MNGNNTSSLQLGYFKLLSYIVNLVLFIIFQMGMPIGVHRSRF